MSRYRISIPLTVLVTVLCFVPPMPVAQAEDIAAPAADETLIYIFRVGRFVGGGAKLWIAVNDQTVALNEWLTDVEWIEVNPDAITPRIREREDIVADFVRSAAERAKTGAADFHLLASGHAY